MQYTLILSSSPNSDGLTAACAEHAAAGIKKAGGVVKHINLNKMKLESCRACDNGWGICRNKYECIIKDDFAEIKKEIDSATSVIIITPVYWGEMSESAKCFFDRLRRCEASKYFSGTDKDSPKSALDNKNAILIAAAGGSGNGTLSCLTQMENMIKHVRGKIFDRITVTRFNKKYKLDTIAEAAYEVVNPSVLK